MAQITIGSKRNGKEASISLTKEEYDKFMTTLNASDAKMIILNVIENNSDNSVISYNTFTEKLFLKLPQGNIFTRLKWIITGKI
jgi:hypothetical protein